MVELWRGSMRERVTANRGEVEPGKDDRGIVFAYEPGTVCGSACANTGSSGDDERLADGDGEIEESRAWKALWKKWLHCLLVQRPETEDS